MALGVKTWLAAMSGLLLLLVVVFLPPGAVGLGEPESLPPAHRRWEELEAELRRQSWLYQRIQWRDSLVSLLPRSGTEGVEIFVGLPALAPDSLREHLRTAARQNLAALGKTEPVMPLGAFVVPRSLGLHPDLPRRYGASSGSGEYLIARGGDAPYCLALATFTDRAGEGESSRARQTRLLRSLRGLTRGTPSTPSPLGICAFFGAFGQPGPMIMAWLREGAARYAQEVRTEPMEDLFRPHRLARGPFGKPRFLGQGLSVEAHRCLGGSASACGRMAFHSPASPSPSLRGPTFLSKTFGQDTPVDFSASVQSWEYHAAGFERHIFSDLIRDFGPGPFRRFWTSEEPPREAFQDAFGLSLELWIMDWIRGYIPPFHPGPGVPLQAGLVTVASLVLLSGVAIRMGRR